MRIIPAISSRSSLNVPLFTVVSKALFRWYLPKTILRFGSIFIVFKRTAKRIISMPISKTRSAATVARPVENGIFSFCCNITGLAISPTLPGRMQLIIKPIISRWNDCQNPISPAGSSMIFHRYALSAKLIKRAATDGNIQT